MFRNEKNVECFGREWWVYETRGGNIHISLENSPLRNGFIVVRVHKGRVYKVVAYIHNSTADVTTPQTKWWDPRTWGGGINVKKSVEKGMKIIVDHKRKVKVADLDSVIPNRCK